MVSYGSLRLMVNLNGSATRYIYFIVLWLCLSVQYHFLYADQLFVSDLMYVKSQKEWKLQIPFINSFVTLQNFTVINNLVSSLIYEWTGWLNFLMASLNWVAILCCFVCLLKKNSKHGWYVYGGGLLFEQACLFSLGATLISTIQYLFWFLFNENKKLILWTKLDNELRGQFWSLSWYK